MKKLLILLMIIAAPVWAAEPFTPAQEARIKEMIRETLVSNPDILAQAVDAGSSKPPASKSAGLSSRTPKRCTGIRPARASAPPTPN